MADRAGGWESGRMISIAGSGNITAIGRDATATGNYTLITYADVRPQTVDPEALTAAQAQLRWQWAGSAAGTRHPEVCR